MGDTSPCDRLVEFAAGCDLLVHECTFPHEYLADKKWGIFHTSPKHLGQWAKAAGVKKLMLKHFAVQKGVSVDAMVDEVASEFGTYGLIVGEDLMTIDV